MAFLFVWQFILSGPLEIASGYIGFSELPRLHLGPVFSQVEKCSLVAAVVGLRQHRGSSISRIAWDREGITVSLWIGTLGHGPSP